MLVRLTDRDPRTLVELAGDLGRDPELDDLDPDDLAVHKPRRGEAPLWDFPDGTLHRREVAAHLVGVALGWDLVPTTVLREDGPFGPGSLQRFVAHDPEHHYFHLLEHGDDHVLDQLRRMVVFDLVIDNADRKGGHVLLAEARDLPDGRVHGEVRLVDHGVSFHVEHKLRTVAWHLVGEPIPDEGRAAAAGLRPQLDGPLGEELARLLSPPELTALRTRAAVVGDLDRFPEPTGHHPYPWPLL
ncbi:SCO1664 family protein [Nitriliruptoraceae bacterium ZYF776]|nr:SCO1664 family protein [Profundirhabdus halotolerans]